MANKALTLFGDSICCSGFLANGHLPPVSRLLASYKGDDEIKPETGHRSPGIYLKDEENTGKPLLENHLKNYVLNSHRFK